MKRFALWLSPLILLWLVVSSLLFVDQAEYVYVTQFGRHVATYNGAMDAGLHFKAPWPIQTALRLDRRLQVFDVPTQELLIRDRDDKTGTDKPLPLTFDVYVCWRVADQWHGEDAVDQFVRSFGTLEKAQSFLRSQIISRLKVELSDILLSGLVNTEVGKLRTEDVLQQVRTRPYLRSSAGSPPGPRSDPAMDEPPLSLAQRAEQVGIAIVDIRLRRFNHPAQVRDEIFAKIQADRKREAENYRLQGQELAEQIKAEGELEARRIRADADAEKTRLEGKARAEATRILNDAAKEAPEFYRIVRMLEGYKQMFGDDKTQLILSLDHPLLALFKDLPKLNSTATKPSQGVTPAAGGNGK